MERKFEFKYHKYESKEELSTLDAALLHEAFEATTRSFAPYSKFKVGAAARLSSGEIVYGTNIESEVYPAGICAERNLLFMAATNYPDDTIESLAIASSPGQRECSPCGFCRQSLLDAERRQGSPIRVIMGSESSATIVESAEMLLPFSFVL
ncbi:MAG: cytidine deaminase [Rikenellaceae bacterium]